MTRRVIAVAYSGGRDSTALLHATLTQAALLGVQVAALHVHHGLSPNADAWLAHCEAQCKAWARRKLPVRFYAARIEERPSAGESVEAWARQQRYGALRAMAIEAGARVVLLAHHRRDQAETMLLQALRGAGTAGLAGMPMQAEREGLLWLRPWLSRPRADIEAYVAAHRLEHIEDESNADERYARNRLRACVWPALTDAFPAAEVSLAASAAWAAEATEALSELARIDLARMVAQDGALDVQAWCALSPVRRANALRAWLHGAADHSAPASLVQRLLEEVPGAARKARATRWPHPLGELRFYRGRLALRVANAATESAPPTARESNNALVAMESTLSIRRAGAYKLPGWRGLIRVTRVREGGVPLAWLAQLELRPREGAEQFQAGIGRPPRSLKKQFQSAGIAAWDRAGPLVYSGGQLVYVPGLGIDARVIGLPGQAQVTLRWEADAISAKALGPKA